MWIKFDRGTISFHQQKNQKKLFISPRGKFCYLSIIRLLFIHIIWCFPNLLVFRCMYSKKRTQNCCATVSVWNGKELESSIAVSTSHLRYNGRFRRAAAWNAAIVVCIGEFTIITYGANILNHSDSYTGHFTWTFFSHDVRPRFGQWNQPDTVQFS